MAGLEGRCRCMTRFSRENCVGLVVFCVLVFRDGFGSKV